ncbi:hypothetical protein SESBI_39823 [Sesbania bispinosa]|nr:hypothetical protein SESBI_39823 [Sesbania bispinosa]
MTLEDFFTLTEMKDGLTAPSRVEELVSVMQKEKDCVVKNAGDATRQWAAVASTIAATENKDCLDLFIQLDGLWFINRWLKDAQNFEVDTNDSFVEESITSMLRAVEKLHLDSEKSISSGIHITISNLLDHHSSRVQNRARVLFDSWKGGHGDAGSHDPEPDMVNNASDKIVRDECQPSAVNEAGKDNDHASGLVGSEKSLSRSSDNLLSERDAGVLIQSSDNAPQSSVRVECEDIKERSPNHLASVPSSPHEVGPIHEGLPLCTADQGSFKGQPDVVQSSDLDKKEQPEQNKEQPEQNIDGPPEKLEAPEICSVSSELEPEPVSVGASEAEALESVKEPALEHNVETKKMDSLVSDSNSGKGEMLEMSVSGTEYVGAVKEGKGHVYDDGKDTSNGSDSNKPRKDPRSPKIIDMRCSDNELDCGMVDALEVARQVAQEINREVCSSFSEKISGGGIRRPGSPDSVRKEDAHALTDDVPAQVVSSRQSHSAGTCSEEGHVSSSDNIEAEPECRPDVESLQVTEAARESGGNLEKRLCAFDLNEVNSDDIDASVNTMSSPIPIISASRPGPTPVLPGAPLFFEGIFGWKGSASTSAFRPASPRKNCDNERNLSIDGNSDISKQKQDWLDIDLNVAEGEEGLVKPITEPSGFPSGKSSVELSPKRSSRLELDLNSTGEDVDAQPSDHRMEGQLFLGRNGFWSPSPASSSSSMQPSVRNIDLNDKPCLQTDLVAQGPGKSSHIIDAYGHSKSSDAPVISILGAKVEVGRREHVPQTFSLPNGKAIEPAIDLTMSRTGGNLGIPPTVSYNHSTVFGYNGIAPASVSASPLSFSSSIYGSGGTIPYMLDSRGAPVVPQVGGSSSTVLQSYSQPPIIMSMTGTQLGLNGFGPSRPNFDLNTGFMVEGGTRDALAARQVFFPGQGRTMEEYVRTMPQPSSSGVGSKRKEPDSGWESYPFSYKHPQPPWK